MKLEKISEEKLNRKYKTKKRTGKFCENKQEENEKTKRENQD